MTTIRSVASLKYGVWLFAYLLAVVVVGGALLALGLELGYAEATDLAGPASLSDVSTTDLAAGGILSLLGSFVLLSGVFGILHKLVADSVAAGVEAASPTGVTQTGTPAVSTEADHETGKREPEQPAASSAEPVSDDDGPSEAVEPDEPVPAGSEPTPTSGESGGAPEEPEPTTEPAAATSEQAADTGPADPRESKAEQPTDARQTEPASTAAEAGGSTRSQEEAPAESEESLSEMFDQSAEAESVEPDVENPEEWGQPPEPTGEHVDTSAPSHSGTEPVPDPDVGTSEAETGTADRSSDPAAEEWETKEPETPREPSPEEIAFGTNSADSDEERRADADEGADAASDEGVETDEKWESGDADESDTGTDRSVGNASGTDPLADPDGE